jgi:hypothetical protein
MTVIRLVARLTDSLGNPLQGKPIYFYYSSDGSTWVHIATVATDAGGYASTTYDASGKTWFKAEFKGDENYEPASATAVWEPSGGQVVQPSQCSPLFRVGVEVLDRVVFCVGGYGVTVFVLVLVAIFLLLLFLSRRGK